jgi:hypothetical protein
LSPTQTLRHALLRPNNGEAAGPLACFSRLMAAHIAHAQDHKRPCPTVREFVSEFRGLSGTAKAKAILRGGRRVAAVAGRFLW